MRLLKAIGITIAIIGGTTLLMLAIGFWVSLPAADQTLVGAIAGFLALVLVIYLMLGDTGGDSRG